MLANVTLAPNSNLINKNIPDSPVFAGVYFLVQVLYNKRMIYLDHAAATPVSEKALQAMMPYFSEHFFNPSAPYLPAKHVREAYEEAKSALARTIGAKGVDLVMTSGATESIQLAFTAVQGKVLVATTEHAAVLETAKRFDHELISVDQNGIVNLQDLRQKLDDEVSLVSVSLANNELGTIQPLAEISEIIRETRQDRRVRGVKTPLYLHSDASQALNLIDINVARLGVDLLTINAAKVGGPKGVGALYIAHGVELKPIQYGGGQERGLRSGTENVPGVIGFATAATEAKNHLAGNRKKYQEMASVLKRELAHTSIIAQIGKKVKYLGNPKRQLANFVPICLPGFDAERLVYKLEQREIYLSTGAACAANKGTKSHVLAAIGLSDEEIAGSLRISLGSTNTVEQMPVVAQALAEAIEEEYARITR